MIFQKILEQIQKNKLANYIYYILAYLGIEKFLIRIVYKCYEIHPTYKMQESTKYFHSHKKDIREIRKLFADKKSKKVWQQMIKLRMTMDYRYHPSKDKPQYFAKDIIQYDGNEVFIDCGAYDGKTSVEFMKYVSSLGGGIKRLLFLSLMI